MSVAAAARLGGEPEHVLYGLPCAKCRAYYGADLTECPICGCRERVAANGDQACLTHPIIGTEMNSRAPERLVENQDVHPTVQQ